MKKTFEDVAELTKHTLISYLDDKLIHQTKRILNDLAGVGVEPPYALLVSLIEVTGARINFTRNVGDDWIDNLGGTLDRDQYHFDEAIFETIPSEAEIAGIARSSTRWQMPAAERRRLSLTPRVVTYLGADEPGPRTIA